MPLLIHASGGFEDSERVKGLANDTDILPTVLGLSGFDLKDERHPQVTRCYVRCQKSAPSFCEEVLAPGGALLAVHWRKKTKTFPLQEDEVHELLLEHTRLANTTTIIEPEYRLDLFEAK